MPGDAQDGVREAGLQVGEGHGIQSLVQDHLPEVLQNLINVGIALRISQDDATTTLQPLTGLEHQRRHEE